MSKVLCFSYERLFYPNDILSGPGSRLWEIALALKRKKHDVTIAQLNHEKDYEKEGIKFISWDTLTLKHINRYDVAFIPISTYVDQYFGKINKIPTIVDLSTPISVEAMLHSIGDHTEFFLNDGLLPTFTALKEGDFFICSNSTQKHFYLGMLALMGIKNFDTDLIQIAPLAPRKVLPVSKKKNILNKIVGKNKKILLFMGGLYNWYDYKTPILAMKDILKKHNNAVLVFVGGLNPSIPQLTKENYENAKAFAKKNKLLNKNIYFFDWASSTDKYSVYNESDIAIVTSYDTMESSLSYRMRIIDYWQSLLPVICTGNDELAVLVEEKKLGVTIEVENSKELAKQVINILNNEQMLQMYKNNIKNFVTNEFNIGNTINPIHNFCSNPKVIDRKLRLDYFEIIQNLKKRIKDLEYMKDDKIKTNETLVEELSKREERFDVVLNDKAESEQELKKHIQNLEKEINNLNLILIKQSERINYQKSFIGKYRGSIVYPFYKISHTIGKTRIGKLLRRLIK